MANAYELSAREVATQLGVVDATVRRWALRGDLVALRTPGGQLRFRQCDVDAFLARHLITPSEASA